MSEIAVRERLRKQGWAAPGAGHDVIVRLLKLGLPALVGLLMAYLAMAPLARTDDISFILDKNKVEVAKERMRIQAAQYRGEDNRGRPFVIAAQSAVQSSSHDPVVNIRGMAAEIRLEDGPAALRALRGRYNMETEQVAVDGPILLTGPEQYRLQTSNVVVDLNRRTLVSQAPVEGSMRLGRFLGNRLEASLDDRTVTLTGRARLHIVQSAIR